MMKTTALLVAAALISTGLAASPASAAPTCFGKAATIVGTAGDDQLMGTPGDDVIVGLGGGDLIRARGGDDYVCSGSGRTDPDGRFNGFEFAYGGRGDDLIVGGAGPDCLFGKGGDDRLRTGPTSDSALPGPDDCAIGGGGRDVLVGSGGQDSLGGGAGNDSLHGRGWSDTVSGGPGRDELRGGADGPFGDLVDYQQSPSGVRVSLAGQWATGDGHDLIFGVENIFATQHADWLVGDERDNEISALTGDDVIRGGDGSDCLYPSLGQNAVDGGPGVDYYTGDFGCIPDPLRGGLLTGPGGAVTVDLRAGIATRSTGEESALVGIEGAFGTPGADVLAGDDNANELFGRGGRDRLEGHAGDDSLDGGSEPDTGDGGDGIDECIELEVIVGCEL